MDRTNFATRVRGGPRIGGCLMPLLGLVVAGGVFALLFFAVFTPWAYFLGGRFHIIPGWAGKGILHARSGDFVAYLNLEPNSVGRFGQPRVAGMALLITPRGRRFMLRITGDFPERSIGLDPNHRRMVLGMHRRPISTFKVPDRRPRLELDGVWRDPVLVMNDRGSLARAFLPDGRAWLGSGHYEPASPETLKVTFVRCGWTDSFRAKYGWLSRHG